MFAEVHIELGGEDYVVVATTDCDVGALVNKEARGVRVEVGGAVVGRVALRIGLSYSG